MAPWLVGYLPVRIEAVEGRVQVAAAKAFAKRTPVDASLSRSVGRATVDAPGRRHAGCRRRRERCRVRHEVEAAGGPAAGSGSGSRPAPRPRDPSSPRGTSCSSTRRPAKWVRSTSPEQDVALGSTVRRASRCPADAPLWIHTSMARAPTVCAGAAPFPSPAASVSSAASVTASKTRRAPSGTTRAPSTRPVFVAGRSRIDRDGSGPRQPADRPATAKSTTSTPSARFGSGRQAPSRVNGGMAHRGTELRCMPGT